MAGEQVRVFLADPHPRPRARLRDLLERETDLSVVGEGAPSRPGFAQLMATDPDVVVARVDGGMAAIELCRELLSRYPWIRCVVVSNLGEDEGLLDAILVGAAGYVTSEGRGRSVAEEVRRAAGGERPIDDHLLGMVDRHPPGEIEGLLDELPEQQRRVAQLVAEGRTNAEIAEQLYLSPHTVRNYLSRVMRKLQARNRTEVAVMMALLALERRGLARGAG
ncbi:MAG TPA: response regulator transcription factor [Nitriliruptorales bacterium]|nr:response regulator transcription factor [Nitriliruptorales bacterium]